MKRSTVPTEVIRENHRVLLDVPVHLLEPSIFGHEVIGYDDQGEPVALTEEEVDALNESLRDSANEARWQAETERSMQGRPV